MHMHKRRSIAIGLVLLAVRVTPDEPPRFQATDFPRVASSTAYQPLVMGMVGDFAGVPVKEGFPNHAGERFWVPMQSKHPAWLALDAGGMTLLDRVRSPKSHEAAVWIIQGQAELSLVPRPGPEVLAEAARQGVRLMATPVARDGLIFLAHAGNPVRNATRERLRALYAGESMAWQDLDPSGAPLPIDPLVRNTTSGSHVLLRAL
jgi:ABC-type phosphate transport system substrate-binding protein